MMHFTETLTKKNCLSKPAILQMGKLRPQIMICFAKGLHKLWKKWSWSLPPYVNDQLCSHQDFDGDEEKPGVHGPHQTLVIDLLWLCSCQSFSFSCFLFCIGRQNLFCLKHVQAPQKCSESVKRRVSIIGGSSWTFKSREDRMLGLRGEKEVKQYRGRSTQPPGALRLPPITGVFHLASVASCQPAERRFKWDCCLPTNPLTDMNE